MKKAVVIMSVIILFVFLAGCVEYKSFPGKDQPEEQDLLDEIALIEEELGLGGDKGEAAKPAEPAEDASKEEEVVLPALGEEDSDAQVITVNENELVKLNVKANDADNDEIKYTFTLPLNNMGEWKTRYGDEGEYMVTLTATDGVHTTTKKVKIVVNRVNVPPVIGLLKDLMVKEGKTVTVKPEVSDPNGDAVTVTLSEPLKTGTFVTDHTSAGEYNVKVVASDGELQAEKTFLLVVEDVNVLPELQGLDDVTVNEGEVITLAPTVVDLDGDDVTVTISEPVGDDGVWETGYTDHGEYVVTFTAYDGKDTVTQNVKVIVQDVNKAPEFVEVTLATN